MDNIVIVEEFIHTRKKGAMIAKIDLEKAYDLYKWQISR